MTDPLLSEHCNESNDKIMDFDDTDLMTSNNNFDFPSFKEANNARENNNGDFIGSYEDKIERLNNEKVLVQSRLNNKIVELQTQIVKMKNALEKSEMSKAEIEVEVTKVNKELRSNQRQYNLKVADFEKSKFELTTHFKTLETEYVNQIAQLNSMHRMFQEQVSEEKRSNQRNLDTLHHQINQLAEKVKETEKELSNNNYAKRNLEKTIQDHELASIDLQKKIKELGEEISTNRSLITEQEGQLEILRASENKLKGIIVELNGKINMLESKNFEEKHELSDSRNYQNNLQAQLLDLQQGQIMYEKERQVLLDKIGGCNRRIKDLEESLGNQVRIATNYRDQIKKLENERELQEISVNETNEDLHSKVEELESKLQIQSRVMEEVNDEISSSRENESVAVSRLNKTLEELENYVTESNVNFKSKPHTPPRHNKMQLHVPGRHCQSPPRTPRIDLSGDIESRPITRNIMKNIRHTILNFRERINTLESDRLESMEKINSQDKEIKNLKGQLRRFSTHQKTLESDNSEKQREIDSLLEVISNLKSQSMVIRQDSGKSIYNLKQSLHKASDEYHESIEVRDNYLQSIATMIKDALNNGISSFIDRNNVAENQGDSRRVFKSEPNAQIVNEPLHNFETSTQTPFVDMAQNKDNLQLSGNLVGTFRFMNENNAEATGNPDTPGEKRTRLHSASNCDRKSDHQTNNNLEDKKKSSLKKVIKKTDGKTDTSAAYVDSTKSWPALREVISSELVSLLNRYDVQRAQCQQLISELSAKESIITRLLSNQNSNSAQPHAPADAISRCQQTSANEAVLNNKSPNKISAFSQNNVVVRASMEIKKKPRTVLKPKVDNVSTNASNKKSFKPENQKPIPPTPKSSINQSVATNKRATITSTKRPLSSTGSPMNCELPTDAQQWDASTSCAQKPTVTSPRSTPPATSRSPETADQAQSPNDLVDCDSRLFPMFIRTLLRLIHNSSQLRSMEDLMYFYKICYYRSIDCSKLITINNGLEKVIHCNGDGHLSRPKGNIKKCPRFKTAVHVISVCQYISRKLLATKLFVQINADDINSIDFKDFQKVLLDSEIENSDGTTNIDILGTFSEFCYRNNCEHILFGEKRKQKTSNTIMASSSALVLKTLQRNVNDVLALSRSQVPIRKYKSKQKSYQMNLKTLMLKISELIHIINGQNSVIEIRDEEIIELKKQALVKDDEKITLLNTINEIRTINEMNTKSQTMETDYNILTVIKTKSYLSKVISLCEMFIKDEVCDFTELMKEEELIYRSLESKDCDGLIERVRDGICVALTLCGSVKSIIV